MQHLGKEAQMRDTYIAGVGMTRFGKYPEANIRTLAEEAVSEALKDANVEAKDIQSVFFSNGAAGILTGQEMIRGQVALRNTGLLGKPIINVENACASASTALYLARLAVASEQVDVAMAIGSEKLTHIDKSKSYGALGAAVDLLLFGDLIKSLSRKSDEVKVQDPNKNGSTEKGGGSGSGGGGHSPFMDIYAAWAREYMTRSGATKEDFARVAVKSHYNASLNPKAQYQNIVTLEEVLSSRAISDPLTMLMCAPIGDGAACVIVASNKWMQSQGLPLVKIRSSIVISGTDRQINESGVTVKASALAYEEAGISPQDIDVVELHDAAAPAELITYEELGLCAEGDGVKLLTSGDTSLGGRIPVNTSGGLLSKGHPIGATGCAQIVELADQLRGRAKDRQVENAKVALAENGGGFLGTDAAAMAITILSK